MSLREPDPTPLEEATELYYKRMPILVKQKHLQMVRQGLDSRHFDAEGVTVGSACTGTDVGMLCLNAFIFALRATMGFSVQGA